MVFLRFFSVIASWNPNHPKSHLKNGFTFDGSHLIVPASGLYYVYVQLYSFRLAHGIYEFYEWYIFQ